MIDAWRWPLSLKIICLEEHVLDVSLAKAAEPELTREAPYVHDIGSRYQEDPDPEGDDRPRSRAYARATELASAPAENRLADMDFARHRHANSVVPSNDAD